MNGNSSEYLKVNNINDYEITVDEPKKALELNSITTSDRIPHPSGKSEIHWVFLPDKV